MADAHPEDVAGEQRWFAMLATPCSRFRLYRRASTLAAGPV